MAARGALPQDVIVSGGGATEILPYLPMPHVLNENLVLDGLALIAQA